MIKITVNDLLQAESALVEISRTKLPATTSFKIARIVKKAAAELQLINEEKSKMAEKYGERDEEGHLKLNAAGDGILIQRALAEEFSIELNKFMATEIQLEAGPLSCTDFETVEISSDMILTLEPFLSDLN